MNIEKLIVFILVFAFSELKAQFIEEVYFGVDGRYKCERMNELLPAKYIKNKNMCSTLDDPSSFPIYIGFRFKNKYSVELGYYKEFYMAGYYSDNPLGLLVGESSSIDIIKHFFLRINYDILNYKHLIIKPQINFVYGNSSYFYNDPFHFSHWWIAHDDKGNVIVTYTNDKWKVDYGLIEHYFFIQPSLQLEYEVYSGLRLRFSGGYNQGFVNVGHYRGYFKINNEPREYIDNSSGGNHFFTSLGLSFNFRIKDNPKRNMPRSDVIQFLIQDKEQKLDIGFKSSIDIIKDEYSIYALSSFGPVFNYEYGRIGFSIAMLYGQRHFNREINNAISNYDKENGTTSTFRSNVKFNIIEGTSAIKFIYYKKNRSILSAGLGFYLDKPYNSSGGYTLEHSDGVIKEYDFFIFSVPNYKFYGFIPKLDFEYDINKNFRLGIGIGVKQLYFYNNFIKPAYANKYLGHNYSANLNMNLYIDL